jgi:hypothetical protein
MWYDRERKLASTPWEQNITKIDGVRSCMYVNDGDVSCLLHRVAWISDFFAQTEDR